MFQTRMDWICYEHKLKFIFLFLRCTHTFIPKRKNFFFATIITKVLVFVDVDVVAMKMNKSSTTKTRKIMKKKYEVKLMG